MWDASTVGAVPSHVATVLVPMVYFLCHSTGLISLLVLSHLILTDPISWNVQGQLILHDIANDFSSLLVTC